MITTTCNHRLRPPPLPSTTTAAATSNSTHTDAGVEFRQKLNHLRRTLHLNPHQTLTRNPTLRSAPLSTITAVSTTIASFGIERAALPRIFDMFPDLLTSDPHLHLYPVFDFLLHDVGVPFHDLRKSILRCPRLLLCSVEEQLRPALGFLRGLGFVGASRVTCRTTVLLVYNVEGTMMRKIEYLMGLGFGYDEVAEMVVRAPGLLTVSVEGNLIPKVEYFREVMKGDLEEIKRFPQYFLCSLEGKIKPRHRKLVEYGFSMSLGKMLKFSDGEFEVQLLEMRLRSADERSLNKYESTEKSLDGGEKTEGTKRAKLELNPLRSSDEQEAPRERSLRWQPPPFACVKINVDAAVRVEATFVGCIARNHKGKVLRAYSAKLPAFDPLAAEAEGFKAAARWAISMGFEEVIIEGDAKWVVDSYNKGHPHGQQIAPALLRLYGLSRSLEATEVKFVPRECNCAAHELCQWAARTGNLGHIEAHGLPHRVRDIIKDEANYGVYREGFYHHLNDN